jgi:tripartite-type tricarboxylate transporter receptor subunit TctC
MTRRHALQRTLAAVATTIAIAGGTSLAHAQSYPSKPIRVVVPWPAGGLVDVAARQLGTRLQAALGQPVVIDNKAGAGGNIGADQVAKAPPDGHTLVFTTSALTINTALQPKLPYNLAKDFEPLALVAHAPSVLVVGPATTPGSVKELIETARSKPGKLSYASAGVGSPAHLTGELFKSTQKLFVIHVPYTGAPAALNDQLAGRVDYQFANAAVALPQIRAGKVKALAVTSATRFAALPQVPTMAEAGVPNFEADQWLGVLAPRGLPKPVAERIVAEVNKALGNEEFRSTLTQAGMTAATAGTPAAFDAYLKQDLARWAAVVKAQNIQPE